MNNTVKFVLQGILEAMGYVLSTVLKINLKILLLDNVLIVILIVQNVIIKNQILVFLVKIL
jgi:hypothetical protein